MRILFIHNNNLPLPILQFIYGAQPQEDTFMVIPISQDASDRDDFDTFLDKTLLSSLSEEYDLIVLPLTLSAINPLEFTGIRCAAHIRLDKRYKNTGTPILFLGPDSIDEILRLSELGSFMLTPSVFLSDANTIDQFNEWVDANRVLLKSLSKLDYGRFLNRFEVNAPANFADDHHSIANLWGATVLCRRITKETMPSTAGNAEALRSLFFKYVLTKRDISEPGNRSGQNETETLAIGKNFLLIDDEADKGWFFALTRYLKGANQFDVISEKIQNYEDLSDASRTKIEKGNYDIIFLDLRLNGPDEEDIIEPDKFSGMKVLRKIKEINRGTQVIMFTASNKAWNLKALLDAGADGYYIKQSPEYYTENSLENNFISLQEAIKYCLKRTFLRTIYKKIDNLCELSKSALKSLCEPSALNEYYEPIERYFDQSFILLSSACSSTQFKYAFLSLFGVLEEIVKFWIDPAKKTEELYYFDDVPVKPWDIDKKGLKFIKKGDSNGKALGDLAFSRKLLAIYLDRLGGIELEKAKRIYNIASRRNGFVHNGELPLPYPEIDTPELGDRHSYEDLFEVVEIVIEDCFQ